MKVLVTGAAGFIGYHCSSALLAAGHEVCGLDCVNDYYDPRLKHERLELLKASESFTFAKVDLLDKEGLQRTWNEFSPDRVLHLAAQPGVRYSIENPQVYIDCNIIGFQNIIELVRHNRPEHFVYASSSSVYGGNTELPFSESQRVDNPVSLYAATKASNEIVARAYSNIYDIPSTGLRFFTVYGSYYRPDMAMYKFARRMMKGEPIDVYNEGVMQRDFTFIEDIVDGVMRALDNPEKGAVYNLGRGKPINLIDMINTLEESLGVKAELNMMPMQLGDVKETLADVALATKNLGYNPKTELVDGIGSFTSWFKDKEFQHL